MRSGSTRRSTSAPQEARARSCAKSVRAYDVVAYKDLGPEAVARLLVEDLPLFVINDVFGNDLYEMGLSRYRAA